MPLMSQNRKKVNHKYTADLCVLQITWFILLLILLYQCLLNLNQQVAPLFEMC